MAHAAPSRRTSWCPLPVIANTKTNSTVLDRWHGPFSWRDLSIRRAVHHQLRMGHVPGKRRDHAIPPMPTFFHLISTCTTRRSKPTKIADKKKPLFKEEGLPLLRVINSRLQTSGSFSGERRFGLLRVHESISALLRRPPPLRAATSRRSQYLVMCSSWSSCLPRRPRQSVGPHCYINCFQNCCNNCCQRHRPM